MSDAKQLLHRYGLQPKKTWGQNFLVKQTTINRIVDTLDPTPEDTVVELGAGTGALTFQLVERAGKVFGIERDRELAAVLRQELLNENFELIEADAARFSLEDIDGDGQLLVVGNLPYQITAPILFHLLEERHLFRRAVLMVQREVADRLTATPADGKDYSILSVMFGAYFDITQAIQVSRTHFYPKPRVDSTVVKLETRAEPVVPIADRSWFMRTVKIAFAQRRKTLANNLRAGFPSMPKTTIDEILQSLSIDPLRRGETLDIPLFAQLAQILQERSADANGSPD